MPITPLPHRFLDQLRGHDEVIVSSRDGGGVRSVRTWFAIAPAGYLLLFSEAFSMKVRRWRADPWIRLRIPRTEVTVEGRVAFVMLDEVEALAPLIVSRWADWGATHPEGVRRMLRDGTHVLLRVGVG